MTVRRVRHRLDRSVRSFDGGRLLLGGSPTTAFRLTDAGARWVGDLLAGSSAGTSGPPGPGAGPGEERLLGRLLEVGVVHPEPEPPPRTEWPAVTMVVPVRDRPGELAALLDSVERSGETPDQVVVVDDGSRDSAAHRAVAEAHGARFEQLASSAGPAAARHAGVRVADHDVVVFVDSDVEVGPGWLSGLVAHLGDDRVVAVAGRVRSAVVAGRIGDYEQRNGPLDLGPEPGPVGPGRRIGHVPAALLLVRRDAYLRVGGFDADLRVGEDVDLVWRLVADGGVVRHEPRVVVAHRPRSDLRSWWTQRSGYGASAAALDERHPGSVPPWRSSVWSLAVVAAAAAGHPVVAGATAAATALLLIGRLPGVPPAAAVRIGLEGHAAAGASFARASLRVWWPVAVLGLLVGPTRRPTVRLLAAAVAVRWWNRGSPLPVGDLPVAVADDVAYGTGVWAGCLQRRRWGPLLPDVRR